VRKQMGDIAEVGPLGADGAVQRNAHGWTAVRSVGEQEPVAVMALSLQWVQR
jgi:hypothetical protein